MIKINLLEKKKALAMPTVLGVDLNMISIKGFILAIAVAYIPDLFLEGRWKAAVQVEQKINDDMNQTFQKLNKEYRKKKNLKAEIDRFVKTQETLNNRLKVVEKVLQNKRNPYKLLFYLTENIPDKVWLNSVVLENTNLELKGESTNFKSIGTYVNDLENSTFFGRGGPRLGTTATVTNNDLGRRVETFSISGSIRRFD